MVWYGMVSNQKKTTSKKGLQKERNKKKEPLARNDLSLATKKKGGLCAGRVEKGGDRSCSLIKIYICWIWMAQYIGFVPLLVR